MVTLDNIQMTNLLEKFSSLHILALEKLFQLGNEQHKSFTILIFLVQKILEPESGV